jgi:hypothetical protein
MISSKSTRTLPADSSANQGEDERRLVPVWKGFLHEFRNHLTVLMAATSDLRADVLPPLSPEVDMAISEAERTVAGLTSLATLMDASMLNAEPLIARLGEVVDRAVRLAAPFAGRRASITTNGPRDTGVRNQGSALESLLAVLIVEAACSQEAARAPDLAGPAASPRVRIDAEVGRQGIAIEVTGDGSRLDPSSWRLDLAAELAMKLDATLTAHPDGGAYVVQLR